MASAPPVASSKDLIEKFVHEFTPEKAKRHIPSYLQEMADDCNVQCAKAFEAIRESVRKTEASHFAEKRVIELPNTISIKFHTIGNAYIQRFKEKYDLSVSFSCQQASSRNKEAKLSEFEELISNSHFPDGNKDRVYLATIKFSWGEKDLPKIFPESRLFYSDYQADPTPLEEQLWNAREETGSHTFHLEGRAIKVHRDLLIIRSEYFKTKFASGMKMEDEKDVSAETMEQAVYFFYKKQLPPDLTLAQLLALHRAANKWTHEDLQKCVIKALGQWRDKNPLSKETLETYCHLALDTKADFGPRFKEISKAIREHVLQFVENQKAWEIFEPLVTLDTYTKWLSVAEGNKALYPNTLQLIHQRGAQLIKQAAKEQKEAARKEAALEKPQS